MTTATDDTRLGILEGRMTEQSIAIQELRSDLREGLQQVNARLDEVNARFEQTNNRIHQLTLAVIGVGGTVAVAILSFAGVLAFQLIQNG